MLYRSFCLTSSEKSFSGPDHVPHEIVGHEEETYEELNRRLPNIGDIVTTEDGIKGEVQSINVLRQLVKIIVDSNDGKEIVEYEVDKLRFKKRVRKDKNESIKEDISKEEIKKLEYLEKVEGKSKLNDN